MKSIIDHNNIHKPLPAAVVIQEKVVIFRWGNPQAYK
jgi:hypothetical protein